MTTVLTKNQEDILEKHGYGQPVPVGEGSFSRVYRVSDRTGRFWACRVSEATGRWEQECRNWKEIMHPLFPMYREQWTEGRTGYLVIEYWEGMDLCEFLKQRKRLSPEQVVFIAGQLAEGLRYLHERPHPFLYRDLKPENIRIRSNGKVGLLDLGCLWNREQEWSGAGNRIYSAPEQFRPGEVPGEESDVYAVGKLLGVMLGEDNGKVQNPKRCRDRHKTLNHCGRKQKRQEKWLRRLGTMATCGEREMRIPDMETLYRLLTVTDTPERERRHALQTADFYYIRKLYYP